MVQGLKAALDRISGEGWSGLELNKPVSDQAAVALHKAMLAEAAIVADMVATPEGRRFFDWLLMRTVLCTPTEQQQQAQAIEAYAIASARRDGMQSIVFSMLAAMREHQRLLDEEKANAGR